MTRVEESLREMLNEGEGEGRLPELRTDFRKLQAKFICFANGNEVICSRFKPNGGGTCTFKNYMDSTCGSVERV